jgi:hypothetical protein
MMNKPDIPKYWSAEEALTFVAFLEDIISTIWKTHGQDMARHLQRIHHLKDRAPPDCADPQLAEDLPF